MSIKTNLTVFRLNKFRLILGRLSSLLLRRLLFACVHVFVGEEGGT